VYISADRVIIIVVIGTLIVTSAGLLYSPVLSNPVTREEAIEISKNSELVREGLAVARGFTIETHYYNSSGLEQLREWHSDEIFKNIPKDAFWEEKVPEGHTAWQIVWWFGDTGAPSEGYAVIVIVDADMGMIIHEEKGIHLL